MLPSSNFGHFAKTAKNGVVCVHTTSKVKLFYKTIWDRVNKISLYIHNEARDHNH